MGIDGFDVWEWLLIVLGFRGMGGMRDKLVWIYVIWIDKMKGFVYLMYVLELVCVIFKEVLWEFVVLIFWLMR